MGFRCFEIDVHDGTFHSRLYITHGGNKVNDWDMVKAFEIIAKYAFAFSDSPVVISVEKHFDTVEGL